MIYKQFSFNEFMNEFYRMGRDYFSPEGYEILYDTLAESCVDTELDVIAIVTEYEEMSYQSIINDYDMDEDLESELEDSFGEIFESISKDITIKDVLDTLGQDRSDIDDLLDLICVKDESIVSYSYELEDYVIHKDDVRINGYLGEIGWMVIDYIKSKYGTISKFLIEEDVDVDYYEECVKEALSNNTFVLGTTSQGTVVFAGF